mgnify:CR=1 FL=1
MLGHGARARGSPGRGLISVGIEQVESDGGVFLALDGAADIEDVDEAFDLDRSLRNLDHVLGQLDAIEPVLACVEQDDRVFELTGTPEKIDAFADLMRPLGLQEMARTGVAALLRGEALVIANLVDDSRLLSLYAVYSLADEAELALNVGLPFGDQPEGLRVRSEFGLFPRAGTLELRLYF